jgi:hypothetical protein
MMFQDPLLGCDINHHDSGKEWLLLSLLLPYDRSNIDANDYCRKHFVSKVLK